MLPLILAIAWAAQAVSAAPVQAPAPPPATTQSAEKPKADAAPAPPPVSEEDLGARLLRVKRIFVESFGDDPVAQQIQAMVVSRLTESKRFIVTENREKADAFLRGAGLEKTSQEVHSYSEGTAAGAGGGGFSASGLSASGGFHHAGAAIEDAATHTETVNDARVAVRLVDPDGDVIWATTQESKGGKYQGASADVAQKVVKQLLWDIEKLLKETSSQPPATN
jgi:curli biogenesis system outer membrane secretion channel CsgG